MNFANHVALVTGANRGIGEAYVHALLKAGASRVYAAVRKPESAAGLVEQYGDRIRVLALDVTDPRQIEAAAAEATDATMLINNAGYAAMSGILTDRAETSLDAEWRINVLGPFRMARAFVPIIKANGGGFIVNLNSVVSFRNFAFASTYSVSKAAAFSATQALRDELASSGIKVVSVHPGPIDTDMGKDVPLDKVPPSVVADATLRAMEAGEFLVFPDPYARQFAAEMYADPRAFIADVQAAAATA